MASRFDQILCKNSENTDSMWRSFARLDSLTYKSRYDNWGVLAYGYKAAVDIVAADQINGSFHRQELFPPIFFLYRHYVELELKAIQINLFNHGLVADTPQKNHLVMDLWRTILCAIVRAGLVSAGDEFVAKVGKSAMLFDQTDRKSMNSRYPTADNINSDNYHAIIVNLSDLVRAADDFETFSYALYELMRARYEVEL